MSCGMIASRPSGRRPQMSFMVWSSGPVASRHARSRASKRCDVAGVGASESNPWSGCPGVKASLGLLGSVSSAIVTVSSQCPYECRHEKDDQRTIGDGGPGWGEVVRRGGDEEQYQRPPPAPGATPKGHKIPIDRGPPSIRVVDGGSQNGTLSSSKSSTRSSAAMGPTSTKPPTNLAPSIWSKRSVAGSRNMVTGSFR